MSQCCDGAVETTDASCLDFDLRYKDESGAPEDVTDFTFAIFESQPASLKDAYVLTKTDPANGVVHIYLAADDAAKLGGGRTNWIRVARTSPDGCREVTPKIWIQPK